MISRPVDKKKVVFYHDHTSDIKVDEEFQKLWRRATLAQASVRLTIYVHCFRSVAVDSMDDAKIEEYLEKQGIRSMQDQGFGNRAPVAKKKPNVRKGRRKTQLKDNKHVELEDYDGLSADQPNTR